MSLIKLSGANLDSESGHKYGNIYSREKTKGPERICIAKASGHIALLADLIKILAPPFKVLYVLLTSRTGRPDARYESPSLTYDELELFIWEFMEFFEQDGRHTLWIHSLESEATLVYDQHNLIYCYGVLEQIEPILKASGLTQGHPTIPCPHAHNYHYQFDNSEEEVLKRWEWRKSDLVMGVDCD